MTDNIKKYLSEKYISFHTPAHKGRNKYINNILNSEFDLTELDETDNLFDEKGCIKELEEGLAKDFGCEYFYLLVNGATSGMMAVTNIFGKGDKILVDRNCHISVLNGFILSGAIPVFVDTELNDFNIPKPPTVEKIKEAYRKNPDIKALIVTSPNYYGLKADLNGISAFCKENNIISVADEAHGSHFYYRDKENTAIGCGFDVAVLSFHKNLPGLTQTGGMAINNRILSEKLKEKLRAFTSTSPSYIFMLSFDGVRKYMNSEGKNRLDFIFKNAEILRNKLAKKGIKVLESDDVTRLVINSKNADKKVLEMKKKYKVVCEMSDSSNATFILSLHNTKKELDILKKGIEEFLFEPDLKKEEFILPKQIMSPTEAILKPMEFVPVSECAGRISGEYIIKFPPSVPVIVPGERFNEEIIKKITNKREIKCIKE